MKIIFQKVAFYIKAVRCPIDKQTTMLCLDFFIMAHELLVQHGISDWHVTVDRSTRRAGICYYNCKRLSFSRHLAYSDTIPDDEVRNIVLHEIAHVLVGPGHGHNDVWRDKALAIGCDGSQYHKLTLCPPKYVIKCQCGRSDTSRMRLRKVWLQPGVLSSCCMMPVEIQIQTDTSIGKN